MINKTTISLAKGTRSLFFRQQKLEEKGWQLEAGQQRRFENKTETLFIVIGFIGTWLFFYGLLFGACDKEANPFWSDLSKLFVFSGLSFLLAFTVFIFAKKY